MAKRTIGYGGSGGSDRVFNQDELVFDDANTPSFKGRIKGATAAVAGRAQSRQRDPFARSMGPGWDSYFGLMQAKENAANASGRSFRVDTDGWGNSGVKPTTVWDAGQVPSSVDGIYNTSGYDAGDVFGLDVVDPKTKQKFNSRVLPESMRRNRPRGNGEMI